MLPLPKWPAFDAAKPHPFFVSAAAFYKAWRALGVPIPMAIGHGVTQPEFECAFNIAAIGDNGTAHNAYQWHWHPRGEQILAGIQTDIRTERNIPHIVGASMWELRTYYKPTLAALMQAKTAPEAARISCVQYEGAGAPSAADRRALGGERWSVFIGQHPDFFA